MSDPVDEGIARARTELAAAGLLADYGLADVSDEEARRAVSDAEAVVDMITAWLVER